MDTGLYFEHTLMVWNYGTFTLDLLNEHKWNSLPTVSDVAQSQCISRSLFSRGSSVKFLPIYYGLALIPMPILWRGKQVYGSIL